MQPLDLTVRGAVERSGPTCRQLSIGGVSVEVVSKDGSPVAFPAEHELFSTDTPYPDLTVEVEWLENIACGFDRPVFDSGATWRSHEWGAGICFDFGYPLGNRDPSRRLFVDRRFQRATLQISSRYFSGLAGRIPVLAYPLDELLIMHRLTQECAIELHGTGIVGANGVGNLFVGHSGAGKSTTTRLWTAREEVEVLSDDRIIVRTDRAGRDETLEASFQAVSSGAPGGLLCRDASALRKHRLAEDDRAKTSAMRMYGTPWHGEAMFASPNSAPLTRIFVLEHGKGNKVTPLSKSQAVGELFARAFVPFHRHEYVDNALSFLEQLAGSVPCYRYDFEPDERAVEKILHFHD